MRERVAVVGAGMSGLVAARALRQAGQEVTLFDKGRRPGGRMNTREHGERRFDHGAQFFTVRDHQVRPMVEDWIAQGRVEEWRGTLVRISGDSVTPAKPATRYVGVPGMVDLALHLAAGLDVRTGLRVAEVAPDSGRWVLRDTEDRSLGRYDRVVVAVPPAQALPLLDGSPPLQAQIEPVRLAPCWAAMVTFEERLDLGFDGAFMADGPLSWVARDSSKPGRPTSESWVLHAGPEWTREQWDTERPEVATLMVDLLARRFGPLPRTDFERAHRWGFALAGGPVPGGALYDEAAGLGVCGDWCVGGRVEGAIVSGLDVARRILA